MLCFVSGQTQRRESKTIKPRSITILYADPAKTAQGSGVYDMGNGYAGVKTGDCYSDTDNGYYVNGTVDQSSTFYLDPNTGNLQFGYTDPNGVYGTYDIPGYTDPQNFTKPDDSSSWSVDFGQAVIQQVIENFEGSKAFQDCKNQQTSSFNNNAFIKSFSLVAALRNPTPFAKTTAEALMVKGGATLTGYALGATAKGVGSAFVAAGSPIRGGSYIYLGETAQVLSKTGAKLFGVAGTAATIGATATDLAVKTKASYNCKSLLN